jgi:hypothetical protein
LALKIGTTRNVNGLLPESPQFLRKPSPFARLSTCVCNTVRLKRVGCYPWDRRRELLLEGHTANLKLSAQFLSFLFVNNCLTMPRQQTRSLGSYGYGRAVADALISSRANERRSVNAETHLVEGRPKRPAASASTLALNSACLGSRAHLGGRERLV